MNREGGRPCRYGSMVVDFLYCKVGKACSRSRRVRTPITVLVELDTAITCGPESRSHVEPRWHSVTQPCRATQCHHARVAYRAAGLSQPSSARPRQRAARQGRGDDRIRLAARAARPYPARRSFRGAEPTMQRAIITRGGTLDTGIKVQDGAPWKIATTKDRHTAAHDAVACLPFGLEL